MLMQLNRDHVHVSLSGLSYEFKDGKPVHIPTRIVKEIIAIGGVAVDADKVKESEILAQIAAAKDEADERSPKILAAVNAMLERDQRGDFTAGGRPNLKTLAHMTGFEVSAQELEPIWNKRKEELK